MQWALPAVCARDADDFFRTKASVLNQFVFLLAILSVSFNAGAQIALRKTMLSVGALPGTAGEMFGFAFSVLLSPWFIGGMACYVFSIGVWLLVLSKLEVSAAYPLLSIGYVITAVVGFFFMGESVTLMRVAGIALICAGLFFITRTA
jgi:multidrug transporter EmrE-like cation transporter